MDLIQVSVFIVYLTIAHFNAPSVAQEGNQKLLYISSNF